MKTLAAHRFGFIGHALRGDGPFRPAVAYNPDGTASAIGQSYLIQYPRESKEKFARRNEVAFYSSPLAQSVSHFTAFLATKPVMRDIPNDLYKALADNTDGKGNSIDVFWQEFMFNAKARGSMLLLVDMPSMQANSLSSQIENRMVPYWTNILPETVIEHELGDDGKFNYVIFAGFIDVNGEQIRCNWRFDRQTWRATDAEGIVLSAGEHPLSECPVLIFTEGGDYPYFGPFASIADLARRLFNLESELDEILRSQTFSLLTMQVPENSTDAAKLQAAQVAGQTIGTSNLLVHSGSTPAFIAPNDGPASTYMERIRDLRSQIKEIGLQISSPEQSQSGIALQLRFQMINAELSKFAARMEDLERRAWDLSRQWLGMTMAPAISWAHDFNIADVSKELEILDSMRTAAMPNVVLAEQQKRIVNLQFMGAEQESQDLMMAAITNTQQEV
jgi:hypothetical protein